MYSGKTESETWKGEVDINQKQKKFSRIAK